MKQNPSFVLMINSETGQKFTNEQILKRAVSFARALVAAGASGKTIMVMLNNHELLLSLYFGSLFSDTKILMLDTYSTTYELHHFLSIAHPHMIVCEGFRYEELMTSAERGEGEISLLTLNQITRLAERQRDTLDDFVLPSVGMDEVLSMLPTSGSTGRSKCAELTHRGIAMHLPSLWSYHSKFPQPTELALLLSTAQWMTWTCLVSSCPVYQVTILLSPDRNFDRALDNSEKYKATWTLIGAACAGQLRARLAAPTGLNGEAKKAKQLSSLQTVLFTGAHVAPSVLEDIKSHLSSSSHVCDGYGMTEAQGFVTLPKPGTPTHSVGPVFNIMDYKLVDEDGQSVGAQQSGELYLRGDCIIKGYLNDSTAYQESIAGEWLKTGDIFKKDHNGNLFFIERRKFWFKHNNTQISPEELEDIINSVPGVHEVAVVDRRGAGAAAGVVRRGKGDTEELRQEIVRAVAERLVPNKHLRGGVVFTESLPRTASGKLHRMRVKEVINQLLDNQEKVPGRHE